MRRKTLVEIMFICIPILFLCTFVIGIASAQDILRLEEGRSYVINLKTGEKIDYTDFLNTTQFEGDKLEFHIYVSKTGCPILNDYVLELRTNMENPEWRFGDDFYRSASVIIWKGKEEHVRKIPKIVLTGDVPKPIREKVYVTLTVGTTRDGKTLDTIIQILEPSMEFSSTNDKNYSTVVAKKNSILPKSKFVDVASEHIDYEAIDGRVKSGSEVSIRVVLTNISKEVEKSELFFHSDLRNPVWSIFTDGTPKKWTNPFVLDHLMGEASISLTGKAAEVEKRENITLLNITQRINGEYSVIDIKREVTSETVEETITPTPMPTVPIIPLPRSDWGCSDPSFEDMQMIYDDLRSRYMYFAYIFEKLKTEDYFYFDGSAYNLPEEDIILANNYRLLEDSVEILERAVNYEYNIYRRCYSPPQYGTKITEPFQFSELKDNVKKLKNEINEIARVHERIYSQTGDVCSVNDILKNRGAKIEEYYEAATAAPECPHPVCLILWLGLKIGGYLNIHKEVEKNVPPVTVYAQFKEISVQYAQGDMVRASVLVLNTFTDLESISGYDYKKYPKKSVKLEWYVGKKGFFSIGDPITVETKEIELDPFISKFVVLYWCIPPEFEEGNYIPGVKVYIKQGGSWTYLPEAGNFHCTEPLWIVRQGSGFFSTILTPLSNLFESISGFISGIIPTENPSEGVPTTTEKTPGEVIEPLRQYLGAIINALDEMVITLKEKTISVPPEKKAIESVKEDLDALSSIVKGYSEFMKMIYELSEVEPPEGTEMVFRYQVSGAKFCKDVSEAQTYMSSNGIKSTDMNDALELVRELELEKTGFCIVIVDYAFTSFGERESGRYPIVCNEKGDPFWESWQFYEKIKGEIEESYKEYK